MKRVSIFLTLLAIADSIAGCGKTYSLKPPIDIITMEQLFFSTETGTCDQLDLPIRNMGSETVLCTLQELLDTCNDTPFSAPMGNIELQSGTQIRLEISYCPQDISYCQASLPLTCVTTDSKMEGRSFEVELNGKTWSPDDDNDGYKFAEDDCNDHDPNIHPGADEHEDYVDNDCDGATDEGTHLSDDDRDGYSEREGDCDDHDPAVNPGFVEGVTPDGIDNNCNIYVDELTDTFDDDRDGFSEYQGDCLDGNASIYPGALEIEDYLDNDCDGLIDDETALYDDDGDGFLEPQDCDDAQPYVYPGSQEQANGIDEDCDGITDNDTIVYDDDRDGYSEVEGDCNDFNSSVYPRADETPNGNPDGIDNDCDGSIDEK